MVFSCFPFDPGIANPGDNTARSNQKRPRPVTAGEATDYYLGIGNSYLPFRRGSLPGVDAGAMTGSLRDPPPDWKLTEGADGADLEDPESELKDGLDGADAGMLGAEDALDR
jgi:hypothetical protein